MLKMVDHELVVKESLSALLTCNSTADAISGIDEIVLNYVVSYLEELGCEDTPEEVFDVDEFKEMMDAYLPGFSDIDSAAVYEWVFNLANRISQKGLDHESTKTTVQSQQQHNTNNVHSSIQNEDKHLSLKIPAVLPDNAEIKMITTIQNTSLTNGWRTSPAGEQNKKQNTEPGAVGGHKTSTEHVKANDEVKMLLELFPAACSLEITECLSLARGDMTAAADLILHRQEAGTNIKNTMPSQPHKSSTRKKQLTLADDKSLKKTIVSKYGFIDEADDKVNHKPVCPNKESKKMVRYRDSQVVSLKGERFSEVKKQDAEEMKKTYINLKPARQYRFH